MSPPKHADAEFRHIRVPAAVGEEKCIKMNEATVSDFLMWLAFQGHSHHKKCLV